MSSSKNISEKPDSEAQAQDHRLLTESEVEALRKEARESGERMLEKCKQMPRLISES